MREHFSTHCSKVQASEGLDSLDHHLNLSCSASERSQFKSLSGS